VGKETTFYELAPIVDACWGRAFELTKEDRTSYAVNLGDEAQGMAPACDCVGFLRWGHRGPCRHRGTVLDYTDFLRRTVHGPRADA